MWTGPCQVLPSDHLCEEQSHHHQHQDCPSLKDQTSTKMDPVLQSRVCSTTQQSDEMELQCRPTPSMDYKHKTVKTVGRQSHSYLATICILLLLASKEVLCSWIGAPPPSIFNRRPEPLDRRPEPLDRRPEPFDRRPESLDRRPEPLDRRPEPFDRRPEPLNRRPEPFDRRPEPFDRRPEPLDRRPEPLDRRPEPFDRRPEPFGRRPESFDNNNSPDSLRLEFEEFVRSTGRPQRLPSPFLGGTPTFPSAPSSSSTFSSGYFPFASFRPNHNEVEGSHASPSRIKDNNSRRDGPGGCDTQEGGFRFAGETWYSTGCRRNKCLHFRGRFFVETDSCDTEFYNTVYKCIVVANTSANYPECCPRYECNPDNLGYSTK
ncbi:uncharacterized protein LOC143019030 [Oratosquilla oratoria]|uniref:uncharacterized protein LOC143019030 n=1 Tax=Oratosquilla oratoria TaxID=337810 RepID=UPI003F76FD0A